MFHNHKYYSYCCSARFANDTRTKDIEKLQELVKALAEQNFTSKSIEDTSTDGDIKRSRKLKRRASQFIMQPEEYFVCLSVFM